MNREMNLAETVQHVFNKALFHDEELVDGRAPNDAVIADGITCTFGFHPKRLSEQRELIRDMLKEMPSDFQKDGGGGTSFLNLCMDRNGNHWAEHSTMAQLVALGIGVGMASYPMPRSMWSVLPGGMPYVSIDTTIA